MRSTLSLDIGAACTVWGCRRPGTRWMRAAGHRFVRVCHVHATNVSRGYERTFTRPIDREKARP